MTFVSHNDQKSKAFWVTLFSILGNFVLFGICYYLKFPFRLEHTGTLFATLSLGSGYGLLVGIICQLIFSLFYFGFSSILYFIIVMCMVFFISFASRNYMLDNIISGFGVMTILSIIYSLGYFLLGLFLPNMLLNSPWQTIFTALENAAIPLFFCAAATIIPFRVFDIFITFLIVFILYSVMPKEQSVSFKR